MLRGQASGTAPDAVPDRTGGLSKSKKRNLKNRKKEKAIREALGRQGEDEGTLAPAAARGVSPTPKRSALNPRGASPERPVRKVTIAPKAAVHDVDQSQAVAKAGSSPPRLEATRVPQVSPEQIQKYLAKKQKRKQGKGKSKGAKDAAAAPPAADRPLVVS